MKTSLPFLFTLYGLMAFCFSCSHNGSNGNPRLTIDLQPFSDIPNEDADYVLRELAKVYPCIRLKAPVALPQSAFYPKRNRYRADSLIRYLRERTPENHITIGLTSKDISTTKDKIEDWGVMGLGYCPGNACVASTFRLSKQDKRMQLFKVAIHELGHTQGLDHCEVNSCFMRDAEGRNPTNEEKEFCKDCKAFLEDKGWSFSSPPTPSP